MAAFHIALVLLLSALGIFAGSQCPAREDISPCKCLNVNLSKKKTYTIVICDNLKDSDSLSYKFPQFARMDIERFIMFDSFWEIPKLGSASEIQRHLPNDWLMFMTMKEVEIIDTPMSPCFACQWNSCSNSKTTSLKIINSTSSDKICTMCLEKRTPWITCFTKLEYFQLSYGDIKMVTIDYFPLTMPEIRTLNFTHNRISRVDPNSFRSLTNLKNLDLSFNRIEKMERIFNQETKLEFIDLSHNLLKTLSGDLFAAMPGAKSINIAYNSITDFKHSDFRRLKDSFYASIKRLDLTGNPIKCNCHLRWVNSTFPVHTAIAGTCNEPEEYQNSRLRTVSRAMVERCDAANNLHNRTASRIA